MPALPPASASPAPRALTTPHFLLLFAAMLVAAAGNTALQSVMPAIGREMESPTSSSRSPTPSSAVLWVHLGAVGRGERPSWAQALTMLGVGGFIVSRPCAGWCWRRVEGRVGARWLSSCSALRAALRSASAWRPHARRRPISLRKTRRSARVAALSALSSSFGLGTSSAPRWRRCSCCRSSACRGRCSPSRRSGAGVRRVLLWLPDDSKPRQGKRAGHGAAMSYPSLASSTTGASVVASTAPRDESG